MTDTRSRRAVLLRGLACAAGSVALAVPVREAYAAKFPQSSPAVAYQDSSKAARFFKRQVRAKLSMAQLALPAGASSGSRRMVERFRARDQCRRALKAVGTSIL
jgi:hypothetical protein